MLNNYGTLSVQIFYKSNFSTVDIKQHRKSSIQNMNFFKMIQLFSLFSAAFSVNCNDLSGLAASGNVVQMQLCIKLYNLSKPDTRSKTIKQKRFHRRNCHWKRCRWAKKNDVKLKLTITIKTSIYGPLNRTFLSLF